MLPRFSRIAVVVLIALLSIPASLSFAQTDLYWCPICRGDTHHRNGHPHFRPDYPNIRWTFIRITNETESEVTYSVRRSGLADWSTHTLEPGGGKTHWYLPASDAKVRFLWGGKTKAYPLDPNVFRNRTPQDDDGAYYFRKGRGELDLYHLYFYEWYLERQRKGHSEAVEGQIRTRRGGRRSATILRWAKRVWRNS